ncbi:hypothetical protein [Paraclostridium bifermentans]|uniref:hypothetical protein n=1 Tax=Paraclostridium bifermentans TaxID=1490 RepID=UPI0003F8D092|nr:hypothetical protein [Paraclostridium bifermentans]
MYYILNSVFELIIFQNILLQYFDSATYIDEIVTILLTLMLTVEIIRQKFKFKINRNDKKALFYFISYFIIGILSTMILTIQPKKIAILKDILATSKLIICYISILLLSKNIDKSKLSKAVSKRSRIYVVIIFIGAVINLFIETNMSGAIRYGIRSYKFLFGHETYLVSTLVLLIAVISANRRKYDKRIILMGIISILLSLRTKGFLFVIAYLVFYIINKYSMKIKFSHILVILVIGGMLFSNKILDTYSYGLIAARPALHIVGLYLLIKYFPLGSGFGTFASTISGEYYSPIYDEYNISNVSGLTRYQYNYMGDSFWPYIYGQTGLFGVISYLMMLIYIFKSTKYRCMEKHKEFLPAFLIIVYLFISSTSEAIFIDATGPMSIIVLAGYLGF